MHSLGFIRISISRIDLIYFGSIFNTAHAWRGHYIRVIMHRRDDNEQRRALTIASIAHHFLKFNSAWRNTVTEADSIVSEWVTKWWLHKRKEQPVYATVMHILCS